MKRQGARCRRSTPANPRWIPALRCASSWPLPGRLIEANTGSEMRRPVLSACAQRAGLSCKLRGFPSDRPTSTAPLGRSDEGNDSRPRHLPHGCCRSRPRMFLPIDESDARGERERPHVEFRDAPGEQQFDVDERRSAPKRMPGDLVGRPGPRARTLRPPCRFAFQRRRSDCRSLHHAALVRSARHHAAHGASVRSSAAHFGLTQPHRISLAPVQSLRCLAESQRRRIVGSRRLRARLAVQLRNTAGASRPGFLARSL